MQSVIGGTNAIAVINALKATTIKAVKAAATPLTQKQSFCDEFRQNCDEIAVFVTKIVYLGRNPEIL